MDKVKNSLRLIVYGRPQQRGSKVPMPVRTKGGQTKHVAVDSNKKSGPWMKEIKQVAGKEMNGQPLFAGPIRLATYFYFKRPKSHFGTGRNATRLKPSAPIKHAQSPDLAKLVRCLEDALTGVVWMDDKQVFSYGAAQRMWTSESERVEVFIEELHNQ